jgi:hypothetical protein
VTAHQILTSEAHRSLRVRAERGADYGDAVMTCLVVPDEFRRVQAEYPILFRLDAARDTFAAYALFGFEDGENLFLDGDRWDARVLPLAIEIQPFLIGGKDEGGARQVHVDTASPRLGGDEGVRLFDEDGRPTPYLDTVAELLGALDSGYQASAGFFAALRRHELLEPLMLDITLDDGSDNRLVGFHAIDEDRLAALDGHALAELNEGGHLLPLYMALASLSRISALVARKNRKVRGG